METFSTRFWKIKTSFPREIKLNTILVVDHLGQEVSIPLDFCLVYAVRTITEHSW